MINNTISILGYNTINGYNDKITQTLSKYTEITINEDKSANYKEIETDYFLENDKWHIDFFGSIEQFREQVENYKYTRKNISFLFDNDNIKKEIKCIVFSKLFSDEWKLQTALISRMYLIKKLAVFINKKYPNLNSIFELDFKKANIEWIDWLSVNGVRTIKKNNNNSKIMGRDSFTKTDTVKFLEKIYIGLINLTDEREEWEKDRWDIRNLEKYGIAYNTSSQLHYINFEKINNINIREALKKYIKKKLISNNKFSWSSALNYLKSIPQFINYICELEPTWNDLKGLERYHIEMYIEWLNTYANENLRRKDANPKRYVSTSLSIVQKFLSDIQIRENDVTHISHN